MECTASEKSDAEPVNNHPIVFTTAFVALLNFRNENENCTQEKSKRYLPWKPHIFYTDERVS
jgi:hypothetical protein